MTEAVMEIGDPKFLRTLKTVQIKIILKKPY